MKTIKCDYCNRKKVKATTSNNIRVLAKMPVYCSRKCRSMDKVSVTATCKVCKKKFTEGGKRLTEVTLAVRTNAPVVCKPCSKPAFILKCSSCGKVKRVKDLRRRAYLKKRLSLGKAANCESCKRSKGGGITYASVKALAASLGFKLKVRKRPAKGKPVVSVELFKGDKSVLANSVYTTNYYLAGYEAGLGGKRKKTLKRKK